MASHVEVHHWLEVLEPALLEEAQDVDLQRERGSVTIAGTVFQTSCDVSRRCFYGYCTNSLQTVVRWQPVSGQPFY